ncbi:hypothetical protein M885DRAFT_514941 [Pelagophyceae sp. CCMP2097]|nr:hypothetical protein M885DRAFT_514941 [Pelagophyceae sp. CCMP2097]
MEVTKDLLGSTAGAAQAEVQRLQGLAAARKNAITSSAWFRRTCKSTFDQVDFDKSGRVDVTETYVAVLLFYIKASVLAKGLIPPKIEDVRKLVNKVADPAHAGEIDSDEFVTLCVILFEHLVGRVALQIFFAFFAAPLLAANAVSLYYRYYVKGTAIAYVFSTSIAAQFVASAILMTALPLALTEYEKFSAAREHSKVD